MLFGTGFRSWFWELLLGGAGASALLNDPVAAPVRKGRGYKPRRKWFRMNGGFSRRRTPFSRRGQISRYATPLCAAPAASATLTAGRRSGARLTPFSRSYTNVHCAAQASHSQ